VHSLPGRVRVHLAGWTGEAPRELEAAVSEIEGVREARASGRTRNLLVIFDTRRLDEPTLMQGLRSRLAQVGAAGGESSRSVHARGLVHTTRKLVHGVGSVRRRVRIPLVGLERNPALAQQAIERLGRVPGVARVQASHLTGRLLVEYSAHQVDIEELLAELTRLELPDLPGEDLPEHPLDPLPLVESTMRTAGAGLGLVLLGARRALGISEALPGAGRAAQLAGGVGIIDGMPPVTQRLERVLGHQATQVAISGLSIASLTLADSALGLAVNAVGAARLMMTVRARRARWLEGEQRGADLAPANPGATITVAAGQRVPLPATVVSGRASALERSGAVITTAPARRLDAGALITRGAASVQLTCEDGFAPEPRQAPPTPTLYDRYLGAVPPASLAYALALGVAGRSLARFSAGLLLVNPRAALIGAAHADNAAAGSALRAGMIVLGSRERRPIVQPDALVIESARLLLEWDEDAAEPRAARGLATLMGACRRHGVQVELAGEHTAEVAALAAEHGLAATDTDALIRIRALQAQGAIVMTVGDGAHAGHEFAESDLALGVGELAEGWFAGRADVLVADLEDVAVLLEIGARRNAAVSDAVLASALANLAGGAWGLAGDPNFARASQATYVGALTAMADGQLRLRGVPSRSG
jgi:cation-transporting ATPase I